VSESIQSPQHVKALPEASCTHHDTGETPEEAKIGSEDEMGSIDKKDGSLER